MKCFDEHLSPVLYDSLSEEVKNEFISKSGWIRMQGRKARYTASKEKVFIQQDSRSSLKEDFANHTEHFLFKNESLKKESPYAYKWIEDTFGKDFKLRGVK